MIAAALPTDELQRLRRLRELEVLDTPPDPVLDGLLRCAGQLLGYPISLVSLVDTQRQWFLARRGLYATETPREVSFCAHAILGEDLFEVPDATVDPRFADNPLVVGAPYIRAYAGLPISVQGARVGTLCLIDHEPRRLTTAQCARLADLAGAVRAWFESRHEHLELLAERRLSLQRLGLLERLTMQAPGMLFQYSAGADGNGRFSYVSPQLEGLFGLAPEQVLEDMRPFIECAHPEDREGLRATLALAALDAQPWRHDFRVLLPGQAVQWRSARAAPEPQTDGSVLWHGFVADVTEQAEIAQLRSEKAAAEQASVEKSKFLSRVSHELRTPLNAMLGFTQLLQLDAEEPLTPRQGERVAHAHRAARLLLGLINDVLDISRIGQGARELALGPVNVHAAVAACLPLIAHMADDAGVMVSTSAPDGDADLSVTADPRALEQVLLNLLSNGIKYNRHGGRLAVALRIDAARVFIDVRDQGQGLDAAQQARLFQPFERLGAEHTKIEGSGLGLVISRQLAQAMGGRINVDSVAGQGSTFTIELQRHTKLAPPPPPTLAATNGPRENKHIGDECVILLYIEDDPVNVLLVQEALHVRPDWRLVHAADGHSGLALVQALRPTLVLTDVNLPGMSGLDVVRALRHDPELRHTVCIALSADAMSEQVADAMRAGFDDYWTKPVDLRALPGRIESWLGHADSRLADLETVA